MDRPATVPNLPSTSPPRTKRTRRVLNGSRNSTLNFWPRERPAITEINKGRKPATPPGSPGKHVGDHGHALSEGRLADRSTVNQIVDKISAASGRQSYVRKVLRSYDKCNTGLLSKDDLCTAMDRLALGLDDSAKSKVISRLDPDNSNRIPVDRLVTSFEEDFEPLGWSSPTTNRRLATLTRPPFNTMRRCLTPCGMSTKPSREDLESPKSFTGIPQSLGKRKGELRPSDTQGRSGVPLAAQMDIRETDTKAVLQAPQTYALQQQLNSRGSVPMQQLFRTNDPSGRGILPLEDLTHCCQAISPGIKQRDIASLVVAMDPSNSGQVDYRQFVGNLVDNTPAHHKLLRTGRLGHETQHEKWGCSPITRQSMPLLSTASHPTPHSPHITSRSALPPSYQAHNRSASWGTRSAGQECLDDNPLGTGEGLRYGQPDICDEQGEVDERKLVHALGAQPIVQSLTHTQRRHAFGGKPRFAFLSASMPELTPPSGYGSQQSLRQNSTAPCTAEVADGTAAAPAAAQQMGTVQGTAESGDSSAAPAAAQTSYPSTDPNNQHSTAQEKGRGSPQCTSRLGFSQAGGPTIPPTPADLFLTTRGRDRFRHLKYPGTSHTVVPEPGCSQFLEPSTQYVRKSDPSFMWFQSEDKERRAKQAQQKMKATEGANKFVAERVTRDETLADMRDRARLEAQGAAKQRYAENLHSLDMLRHSADTSPLNIHFGNGFGKSVLMEHVDSAAFFNRT
ncbi:hypothetical protein DUNSADRAFT_10390 [Dunaliella salina]|uniref:EF-hand domain-containing protein n=1 Tax=Dunaliella salina TaxID=3046 RepID=A0ABQ7GFG2_DUNSA|nr:hypothetical protein DUNSADRAFT_10390 [Dunaliella salina]|eukprot:KAF5833349.1 hypothetical protein DUNSADRAFT_10390 [Dunaliella salina]